MIKAIHGTESSIARVQAALRKQPARSDHMTPMDSVYGIPFVTHETEDQAKEAAWKQAITERCKVMLVEHDNFFQIDGEVMAQMLDFQKTMPYSLGFFDPNPNQSLIKVQP